MPCTDGGPTHEQIKAEEKKAKEQFYRHKNIESSLCGAFTLLEKTNPEFLNSLDYEEMGVSKDWIKNWWKEHKEQDRQRKAQQERRKLDEQRRIDKINRLKEIKKTLSSEDLAIIKEFGV